MAQLQMAMDKASDIQAVVCEFKPRCDVKIGLKIIFRSDLI